MAAWPFYFRVVSTPVTFVVYLSGAVTWLIRTLILSWLAHLTDNWGKWRRSCQIKSVWKIYISINQM